MGGVEDLGEGLFGGAFRAAAFRGEIGGGWVGAAAGGGVGIGFLLFFLWLFLVCPRRH